MSDFNNVMQQKLEQIKSKYDSKIKAIQNEGAEKIRKINDDAPDPNGFEAALNFTFDIKMKTTSIKFDIPKFSMEREVFKFDIPEVRMETKSIKFDVPATRMKRTCLFKKPVFRGLKIYSECVYGNKPEIYMRRVEIKTDIPIFNSKRVEIKFDKPVVRMETIEIKFDIPHFYLKKLDVQLDNHKNDIEDVSRDMSNQLSSIEQSMKTEIKLEMTKDITNMFDEMEDIVMDRRKETCIAYEDAISKTKDAIKRLKESNAQDEVNKLESSLSKIVTDFQKNLSDIDATLESIRQQELEALNGFSLA